MLKKRTLMAMAITAFVALVVPAMASAADTTKLTMPAGTLIPRGTHFVATSTNWVITLAGIGKLTCPTVTLTGEATENSGSTVAGVGSGSTAGQCEREFEGKKEKFKISDIKLTELMSTGTVTAGTGTADVALSFVAELPEGSGTKCTFRTPSTVTGDAATYPNGGDTLTLAAQSLTSACWNGTLSGSFTLSTDPASEGPIIIDVQ